MAQVEKRWYALRIVATIQAVFAWLVAIGAVGYGVAMGVTMIANGADQQTRTLGTIHIAGGIVVGVVLWAVYMAVAQMIRLFISIEEKVRELANDRAPQSQE